MADPQQVKQEQIVRLAPFQEEFLADIFASGRALTEPGSQMPYADQQLANLSAPQQQAITAATQGVGSYQPYLQQGSQAIGTGIEALGTGLGTIGSAIGQTGQADFNFAPTDYQQFMDPYTESVIAAQQADIARQGQMQQNQLGGTAVGAGAFGGSRQGIAQAEIARNVMDQQARTGSQLRSAGFQQAQNTAMQVAQAQAQQQLKQAQLTGQLGQTTGALGQSIGQLGTATAGLGQLGQQMGVQDVNSLLGVGALQQGQDQKSLDVARANTLAQQALPYQQVGFMSDLFRGVPALQQTYSKTTSPGPSTTSQMLGLGIAGLGAAGAAGGVGNLFNMGLSQRK
tara:strand:+ start:4920 stop:5945 length:1026 start_codon:yes stop_codon:yes gene_type:complete